VIGGEARLRNESLTERKLTHANRQGKVAAGGIGFVRKERMQEQGGV